MDYIPCRERFFPFRLDVATFYAPYSRWLRHLTERLGWQNTLSLWGDTFVGYDDTLLMEILSCGWRSLAPGGGDPQDDGINRMVAEFFPRVDSKFSLADVKKIVAGTPPIPQIEQRFSNSTVEKEITAYHALHLRFDGLASLAEALIEEYGKQGELIVYDLMVDGRLALAEGQAGNVEDFIEYFTAEAETPNLFTAGLETKLIRKTEREAELHVQECEWARYFQERHPAVGYLMACSTDEIAYKAFNKDIRMQRTRTIMEGGQLCDFRIYAIVGKPDPEE